MWMSCEDFSGVVTDLDEGRAVPLWVQVDVEAGLVEAAHVDPVTHGPRRNSAGQPMLYLAKGRFRAELRPRPLAKFDTSQLGAAQCAKCSSPMTLAGDDLCVVCRARERGRVIKVEKAGDVLLARPCENGCGRRAQWQVSDETQVSPQQAVGAFTFFGRRLVNPTFRRASIVARHHYCSWCYRPPRILDASGDVVESLDNVGTRPT